MNEFLAFVRKEFRHILRDKRTMMIVLILPVVQMILFGFAVRTEIENAREVWPEYAAYLSMRELVDEIAENSEPSRAAYLTLFQSNIKQADQNI